MKFPQGEGSTVIHRKKNRLHIYNSIFSNGICFSSFTQFLVALFFSAFYTAPFSSKHFFLGLFVRSLSTQLFFLVVLLLLLLSMTAFSYVGLLSLFSLLSVTLTEPSSTQLFSWGVVFWAVCRARICSLVSFFSSGLFFGLPIISVSILNNLQGRFHILNSFGGWPGGCS